jgi:hypothetical protein
MRSGPLGLPADHLLDEADPVLAEHCVRSMFPVTTGVTLMNTRIHPNRWPMLFFQ